MDMVKELIKKYGNIICAVATAYYLVFGLLGVDVDILYHMFDIIGLGFIVNILYILIGLVGLYKVLEIVRPDVIKKLDNIGKKK